MHSKIQSLLDKAEHQTQSADSGASSVTSANREFSDVSEAERHFARLRQKLFQIRKWNRESGLTSFKLFDENGNARDRENVSVGDFVRLTLAGSGKDDWVKVTDIYENSDEMIMTIKPSSDPTASRSEKNTVSHFFSDEASNNFCLEKKGKTINFYVIGLDEKTNTGETGSIIETVRNFAASNIGYYLGIQKGEWKLFCENFLEVEK